MLRVQHSNAYCGAAMISLDMALRRHGSYWG
jgi:hypothetical protein